MATPKTKKSRPRARKIVSRRASRPRPRSVPAAFFDVDKTIISQNSGTLFLKYLYEQGRATRMDIVKGISSYMQYKLNLLDINKFTKRTVTTLKGR